MDGILEHIDPGFVRLGDPVEVNGISYTLVPGRTSRVPSQDADGTLAAHLSRETGPGGVADAFLAGGGAAAVGALPGPPDAEDELTRIAMPEERPVALMMGDGLLEGSVDDPGGVVRSVSPVERRIAERDRDAIVAGFHARAVEIADVLIAMTLTETRESEAIHDVLASARPGGPLAAHIAREMRRLHDVSGILDDLELGLLDENSQVLVITDRNGYGGERTYALIGGASPPSESDSESEVGLNPLALTINDHVVTGDPASPELYVRASDAEIRVAVADRDDIVSHFNAIARAIAIRIMGALPSLDDADRSHGVNLLLSARPGGELRGLIDRSLRALSEAEMALDPDAAADGAGAPDAEFDGWLTDPNDQARTQQRTFYDTLFPGGNPTESEANRLAAAMRERCGDPPDGVALRTKLLDQTRFGVDVLIDHGNLLHLAYLRELTAAFPGRFTLSSPPPRAMTAGQLDMLLAATANPPATVADVPFEVHAAIHNTLATLQAGLHAAGTGAAPDVDAMTRLAATSYDLELWTAANSTRVPEPAAPGTPLAGKLPRQIPELMWPDSDGGVITALAGDAGSGFPEPIPGTGRRLPGTTPIDSRFNDAVGLARAVWSTAREAIRRDVAAAVARTRVTLNEGIG